ncbi:hypothetical protein FOZ63_010387, partial [Perkinsus olseni]
RALRDLNASVSGDSDSEESDREEYEGESEGESEESEGAPSDGESFDISPIERVGNSGSPALWNSENSINPFNFISRVSLGAIS